jgi:hypothetical protein
VSVTQITGAAFRFEIKRNFARPFLTLSFSQMCMCMNFAMTGEIMLGYAVVCSSVTLGKVRLCSIRL